MGASASMNTSMTDAEKVKAFNELAANYAALSDGTIKPEVKASVEAALAAAKGQGTAASPPKAKKSSPAKAKAQNASTIEEVFVNFCKVYRQDQMTNTIFAKFCKDTKGILDKKKFQAQNIDMVWSKAAGKNKKVGCDVFKKCLEQIAVLKGQDYATFEAFVLDKAKVKNSGTVGESKFYDDKNLWTGVATKGGPDNSITKTDLSALADRDNKADVRGMVLAA